MATTTTTAISMNEARQRTWAELRTISDRAVEAGRDFTGEEETAWQRGCSELTRLDHRIDVELREANTAATLAGYPALPAPSHPELADLIEGRANTARIPIETRDVLKTGTGGNVVPQGFAGQVLAHLVQAAAVAGLARTITTSSVGDFKLPTTTAHSTAALTAEAAAITESDPTFASVTMAAYKYALLVQLSREVIEDQAVNVENYLAEHAGQAVGNALGVHLVTGSGSGQPQGCVTGSTLGKTAAAAAITYAELVDVVHSVTPVYRRSPACGWLMADSTVGLLRKLVDGNGRPIWEPALKPGDPDMLLGHPVTSDPNMPAATTGLKSVLFGDWSRYVVRYAGGVVFERSDDYAFGNDLVTFRCIIRADGRLADTTGAIKHLIQA